MKAANESMSFTIPASLRSELQAAAEEEHRPALEVLQDALKRYLREKSWQKIYAYGEERAQMLGLTEADIPRLIAELRQETSGR